jgi:hypothetical protein
MAMTKDQFEAMVKADGFEAAMKAANAAAIAEESSKPCKLKVTEKGGLSVYGLGRFPVTLYKKQWAKLTNDATLAAIKAQIPLLKDKSDAGE